MGKVETTAETQRQQEARRRAGLIMKVWAREMTAKEAARALGVSRKTYYKWEERALAGMIQTLAERGQGGRPARAVDPVKESLEKEVETLKGKVQEMEQRETIREILRSEPGPGEGVDRTEKKGGGS